MSSISIILQNAGFATETAVCADNVLVKFYHIDNNDGSIRWIWPATSSKPHFLKFYNVQGWKAYVFSALVRLVFTLRIQRFIFKAEHVAINPTLQNNGIADNSDWALFTGTAGPNQKYILYKEDSKTRQGSFTKIGITSQSAALISYEKMIIENLRQVKDLSFQFPSIKTFHEQSVTLFENSDYKIRKDHWTVQHQQFVYSSSYINHHVATYAEFDQSNQISHRIDALKNSRKKVPSGILKKLSFLHHSLASTSVETHFGHGDFTPWNMYANKKGELFIYDWELANEAYPKGFDLFHFIIQNGVLIKRHNWSAIKDEINKASKDYLSNHEVQKYLSFYLLVNVLNYLEIYEKQSNWHVQINWLFNIWNMALSEVLITTVNERELVILDVFDHIQHQPYSGLKLNDQPEKLSEYSDLDLLMNKSVSKNLIQMLKHHPLIQKVNIQNGFAMTKILVLLQNNQILSLDNVHKLKCKSLEYMNVSDLIQRPYIDKDGIKKVGLMDKLQFLGLFYGLNNALIPSKYDAYVDMLCTENKRLDMVINDQFYSKIPNTKALKNEIKKLRCNKGFSSFVNKLTYIIDTVLNIINQKGMIITFSGVDGAGKSTIIEKTKIEMEKKLRKKVVVIRHRPSLLPILSAWTKGKSKAENAAANTLPRQGQNKSFLSSLFRFSYYYVDYLFGQFYIYCKHVLRGEIVLYDRYYFDFINDGLRSNIILPKWLTKIGYIFLLKPDLNFFLYANASTILSRKKELDESTINTLTKDYLDLFKKLNTNSPGHYHAIENIYLDATTQFISKSIQAKLI